MKSITTTIAGHNSYESMKPYIAVANEMRAHYMSAFDKYGASFSELMKNADKRLV